MQSVPACPDERPAEPKAARADGRTLLLELQNAELEAELGELGGMPVLWSQVADVPEDLMPDRFEPLVSRMASEVGATAPEVDCSEFPCVVVAPVEWTHDQFTALRERLQSELDVEDPQLFGLDHGATRMLGVYPEGTATPELVKRIMFRMRDRRHEAEAQAMEGADP